MAITQSPFNFYNKRIPFTSMPGLLSDEIKVALCSSGYVPNSNTHEYYDVDITNELTTGFGYTSGGIILINKSLSVGALAGQYYFISDNVVWTASGGNITAHTFILYNNTPTSNKPLIGWGYLNYNGGTPADVTATDSFPLSIAIPATGWFKTATAGGV